MNYKIIFILIFSLLPVYSSAQTFELLGKQITFGISDNDLSGTFWQQGSQVESEHSYIKVYEYSDDIYGIYGAFYNNKLACIEVSYYTNEPYPSYKEIEDLYINLDPYSTSTKINGAVEICEYYKTGLFYIQRCGVRMATSYTIIPIETLEEINKLHPEYLPDFIMSNKIK